MRPIAEAIPRSRKVPANTASLTSLKCVGVTPHSVHQTGTSGRPYLSSIGLKSSGGLP